MSDILKTIFKMIITGVLSVLFIEIFITLLIVTQIISVDAWQSTPFLQSVFSITSSTNGGYDLSFNTAFENTIAIVFGSIPLVSFLMKKKKLNN